MTATVIVRNPAPPSSPFRKIWSMLVETGNKWIDDNASQLGAALAYYSVFSLGPLLFISIAIAGIVFGEEAAKGQLYAELRTFLGPSGASAIEGLVTGASAKASSGWAATVGLIVLVFTATGAVVQLKDALNIIWQVKAKPGRSIKTFVRKYMISVATILGVGFLLMVSLVLTAALALIGKYLGSALPLPESVLQLVNFCLSFAVITLLFAMIFKMLPDVHIHWRDVMIGAVGTALFFTIGKSLIGIYLGKQALDSTFGAAASLIVILIWVYYSAQILFFGAEFTKVYAQRSGSPITPTEDAMNINDRPEPAEVASGSSSAAPAPKIFEHAAPSG